MVSIFKKVCDKIGNVLGIHYSKNNSDTVKNKVKTAEGATSIVATSQSGDSIAINTLHLHEDSGNRDGNRRNAIRELKESTRNMGWAIEQSKNPRVLNTPHSYQTKLDQIFKAQYAFLSKEDLELLEPLILTITDFRTGFPDLEVPFKELRNALDSIK